MSAERTGFIDKTEQLFYHCTGVSSCILSKALAMQLVWHL